MAGRVYFILDGTGRIKVGYSSNPIARLKALQTAHGSQLTLLGHIAGSVQRERTLHELLADRRLVGEWFSADEELLSFVQSILADPDAPYSDDMPVLDKRSQAARDMFDRVIAVLHEAHPVRPVGHVALRTGMAQSTVAKWFERKSAPSGAVAGILIGAYGPKMLAAMAGDEARPWVLEAVETEGRDAATTELLSALDCLAAFGRSALLEVLSEIGLAPTGREPIFPTMEEIRAARSERQIARIEELEAELARLRSQATGQESVADRVEKEQSR